MHQRKMLKHQQLFFSVFPFPAVVLSSPKSTGRRAFRIPFRRGGGEASAGWNETKTDGTGSSSVSRRSTAPARLMSRAACPEKGSAKWSETFYGFSFGIGVSRLNGPISWCLYMKTGLRNVNTVNASKILKKLGQVFLNLSNYRMNRTFERQK